MGDTEDGGVWWDKNKFFFLLRTLKSCWREHAPVWNLQWTVQDTTVQWLSDVGQCHNPPRNVVEIQIQALLPFTSLPSWLALQVRFWCHQTVNPNTVSAWVLIHVVVEVPEERWGGVGMGASERHAVSVRRGRESGMEAPELGPTGL